MTQCRPCTNPRREVLQPSPLKRMRKPKHEGWKTLSRAQSRWYSQVNGMSSLYTRQAARLLRQDDKTDHVPGRQELAVTRLLPGVFTGLNRATPAHHLKQLRGTLVRQVARWAEWNYRAVFWLAVSLGYVHQTKQPYWWCPLHYIRLNNTGFFYTVHPSPSACKHNLDTLSLFV